MRKKTIRKQYAVLSKASTGIQGLDDVTGGGLPNGGPTLLGLSKMGDPLRVLVVDDSENDALLVLRELRRGGFEPVHERVDTPKAMQTVLETNTWDAIICDYSMPHFSGPAALKMLQALELDLPFIIVSGKVDEETAVELLKAGAHDLIDKGNLSRLVPAVRREIKDAETRRGARLARAILEESEARFHTLARLSPVGIFQADAEGNCLYLNEQGTEIAGLSPEDAAGDGWLGAVHPEDRQRVALEWQRCAAEKLPFMLEFRFRRPDGTITWVLGRAEQEFGDSGQITSFVGTITDVTRLKAIEESLRRNEADLKEAQRVARLGSWSFNVTDDCVVWSDELYRIFGLHPGQPAPKYSEQEHLYFPGSWTRLRSAIEATLSSGAPFELDLEINRPDGPRWLSARGELVRGPDKSVCLRGTALDITERKQAQLAVERNERRFRSLMANSSDFIVVIDGRGIISYASPSLARTGGYAVEDVLGRNLVEFVHPEDAPAAQAEIAALLADPNYPSVTELRYRHKDGRWIVLAAASKNALHDPAVGGIVINARDVTEDYLVRERLRLANEVVENSPTVLYRVRGRGEDEACEYVSQNVRQFGYSAEELISGSVRYRDLIRSEDRNRIAEELDRQIAGGAGQCRLEYRIAARSGELRWIEDQVRFEREGDKAARRQGILRDVTARKTQELRIAGLNRIRAVLSGINSVIVRVRDEKDLVEEACRIATERGEFLLAWVGLLDTESKELRILREHGAAKEFCDAIAPCMRLKGEGCNSFAAVLREMRPYVVNDTTGDPCPNCRRQTLARGFGSYALLPLVVDETAIGLIALYSGECYFFDDEELELLAELAADVSFGWDHIAKERKVAHLALYDSLTGLANRTLFVERLTQQLREHEGMTGVGIVDVERLHNINDTLGWHAGDLVLKTIAERLKLVLGEAGVARADANSFAFYIGHAGSANEVLQAVERTLRDCFDRPFVVSGSELRLSARCGIALYPNDGTDADTVHKNAAVALKRAKNSAERVLFYAPEMNARVGERVNLESRLHQALEQEQFELHYQPKFDSKNGGLTGMEALIRWNDPQRGLVPPGEFIPLLEETGLILQVGQWALERTVRQCNEWRRAHLRVPRVAVNVSTIQLRQKEFVAVVQRAIDQFEGEPCLDLEITESMVMTDIDANIAKLIEIRALGVQIAIDDFGTGYSSLAYLAKLPVNTLKIDRSFIITMLDDADTMTLVSTMIALAHSLSLKVVAEGVDDEEQAKILRLLRCDQMQGYLFGKPIPAAGVPALL